MSCADFEKLIALNAGGDLPGSDAARVEAHLGQCDSCRLLAEELASDREWLQTAHREPADRSSLHQVRTSVMQQLELEQSRWNGPWGWLAPSRWNWQIVVTAAAAALVVAGAVWQAEHFRAALGLANVAVRTFPAAENRQNDATARTSPPASPFLDAPGRPASNSNPPAAKGSDEVAAARRERAPAHSAARPRKAAPLNASASKPGSAEIRTRQAALMPVDENPREGLGTRHGRSGTAAMDTSQIEVVQLRIEKPDDPDDTPSDTVMVKMPTSNSNIIVYWLMDDQEKGD